MFFYVNPDDFAENEGFKNAKIIQKDSISGDKCHYDIEDTIQNVNGKNQYAQYVDKYCVPPNIYVCTDEGLVQLTKEQYEKLTEKFPLPTQFK